MRSNSRSSELLSLWRQSQTADNSCCIFSLSFKTCSVNCFQHQVLYITVVKCNILPLDPAGRSPLKVTCSGLSNKAVLYLDQNLVKEDLNFRTVASARSEVSRGKRIEVLQCCVHLPAHLTQPFGSNQD